MKRLPDARMSQLLKYALQLNEARSEGENWLAGIPDGLHKLLSADRSTCCFSSGGVARLRNVVRRIESTSRFRRRKWSNDRCVVYSYLVGNDWSNESARTIVSIGRNHPSNHIVCGMFIRSAFNKGFGPTDLTMSHLAVGYAVDAIGLCTDAHGIAVELADRKARRLQGGDASLFGTRLKQFLAGTE